MNFSPRFVISLLFGIALATSASATRTMAAVDAFAEDFTNDAANWIKSDLSGIMDHFPSGGPDGGAFASSPRSFSTNADGNAVIINRARSDANSSGGAFNGDWIADHIREVRAFVRHNVRDGSGNSVPVDFIMRVAGVGFMGPPPGHIYSAGTGIEADTWTEVVIDVSRVSPDLLSPENGTWQGVFSNISQLGFGAFVPAGIGGDARTFSFDIDKVTIATPEPASAILGAIGLLGVACATRRRRVQANRAS
jgi:hypothetical protein